MFATVAVYWPVLKHDFVKYDDDKYITDNRRVQGGITWDSVVWAFTEAHFHMWHPLTTLSQMLDCQLYGLVPGRHHLTSLLLHLANTVLLFLVLKRMTGAVWPSAFVAAVFGLHPLQVESVAWLAERKNVLSGFFSILTIGAYVRYAERPGINRLLLVVLVFGLCIMTKPMVVTLPFVLLLLDYWPLGRLKPGRQPKEEDLSQSKPVGLPLWHLILEKVPLFALAALLSVITYSVQKSGGVVSALERLPLDSRIANAVISYVTYIEKMIWPSGLAVFYPHPGGNFSVVRAVVCGVLLVSLTILFIYPARRRKYLAVGWLWYVGTLVPVIGLVQVGAQARADRYMYITMIGLLAIIAWLVNDAAVRWRNLKMVAAVATVVALSAAMVCTRLQLRHWQNSTTLFRHALDVTHNNVVMHNNYANLLTDAGETEEAIKHFKRSLELRPNSAEVHNNFANALSEVGRTAEAIVHYKKALGLDPKLAAAHYNLASVLAEQGHNQQAVAEYRQAVQAKPDYFEAWNELGFSLAKGGRFEEAVECYRKAIGFEPDLIVAHGRLGLVLARLGKIDGAIKHCQIVLRARPDDIEMHFNVGVLLERKGQIAEAIKQYRRALQINPSYTKARQRLEAALAKQRSSQ